MMYFSSSLLLLLPGAVDAYSLFDFNSKPSNIEKQHDDSDVKRRSNVVNDHNYDDNHDDLFESNTQRRGNVQRYNDNKNHDPFEHFSHLPPNESTLSTGLFHTCAITYRAGVDQDTCGEYPCGPVKCWGHNDRGQSSPPPGVMFQQLSSGGFFTCGLKAGGKVACWGDIDHPPKSLESLSTKELDDFKHARRMQQVAEGYRGATSRPVNGGDYYVQVSSGHTHACALTRGSGIHCWGRNDYGESSPPIGKFVQISAGDSFTCGIRSNGAVKCWGKNDMGQSSPPPYPENIFEQVSASIGGDHACGIIKEDGDIRCWGNNGRGQSENQDGKFLQVSAGTRTTCAIRAVRVEIDSIVDDNDSEFTSTSIHCWGSRANALLDHFLEMDPRLNNIDKNHEHNQISLGQDHACASAKSAAGSLDSTKTSLECWWLAGSDFDAHRIPAGLEMVR